jgi:hypothetical protein
MNPLPFRSFVFEEKNQVCAWLNIQVPIPSQPQT